MRSLAASFTTLPEAQRAFVALRATFAVGAPRLRIAALGHASYPAHEDSVVAGAFDEADVAAVREIVERFGGRIVADVDTDRT